MWDKPNCPSASESALPTRERFGAVERGSPIANPRAGNDVPQKLCGIGLSVCRVPTHRDALWCMSGGRPDESGRGRHECLRHGPPAPTRSSPAFASELRYACLLLVALRSQAAVPCACLQRSAPRTLQWPLDGGMTARRTFAAAPIHSDVTACPSSRGLAALPTIVRAAFH